ncbi:MAG: hypothetical protein KTR28_08090 [Micavibrio sp.]|nr:hypothetical protein [Micavibrio sp.]
MLHKNKYTPEIIAEKLFIDDVPVRTKFGVVHGLGGASAEAARLAAGAKKRREVDKIIVTGGVTAFDPLPLYGIMKFNRKYFTQGSLADTFGRVAEFLSPHREALLMADVMMSEGVEARDIIVEGGGYPTSTHAGENVDRLLEDKGLQADLVGEGALKVLGLVYNTRRMCCTWQRKFQDVEDGENMIIVPRSFYPFGFTSDNWPKSDLIKNCIVYPEMWKIDPGNPESLINTRPNDVMPFDEDTHRQRALRELEHINL